MPFLKQQIEIVNAELRRLPLADERFSAGRYEAIAHDCSRTERDEKVSYFPAVMNENYEAQEVTVDDTWPIIIYHKIRSKAYGITPGAGTGDRNTGVTEQVSVKMVVYAKWSKVKMTIEQLEALITTNFPDNINPAIYRPLKLDSLSVVLRGTNFNSAQVWQEEYRGTELRLAPEDIYFSLNYDLISTYRKGCFKICDCE